MRPSVLQRALVLVAGDLLDRLCGDPPNTAHPVVLLGLAARLGRSSAPASPAARRAYGVALALAIPMAAAAVAQGVRFAARRSPIGPAGAGAVEAVLLSLTTSRGTLLARAGEVAVALEADDLVEARRLLAYHLVSRDTSELSASEVAGATIESVAENLHDGVIAPWCAAAIGGVAGAWGYRALNTLDSTWGYRQPFLEELGMGAARLDDLANLVPARLSAACIVLAAWRHEDAQGALRVWQAHAGRTASPNAGHPMAAMAGALGVTLTKRGHYTLGDGREPVPTDIERACELADAAAEMALRLLVGTLMLKALR